MELCNLDSFTIFYVFGDMNTLFSRQIPERHILRDFSPSCSSAKRRGAVFKRISSKYAFKIVQQSVQSFALQTFSVVCDDCEQMKIVISLPCIYVSLYLQDT